MPVRWGVLGTARIAERYVVPAIAASDNGRVIAVSSGSGSEKAFAERLGIPRAYPSHDQLLADPDVDAVYIPLPNVLHRDWAIRVAEAGKHVLCEKPIALSRRQFDEIEAACAANRVHVAEAFMYRVVIGSSGTVELRHPFRPDRNGGNGVIIVSSGGGAETVEVHGDVYRLEVEAFAWRILADGPDEPNTELSRWTVETTERVAQAAGLPPFETETSSAGRTAG